MNLLQVIGPMPTSRSGSRKWKGVVGLSGRPSKIRPRNTSLEDFERLYGEVDDYGWYQGMFEARIPERIVKREVK
jgi:hypothetical protein